MYHVAYGKNIGVVIWAGTRDIIYTTDGGATWTEVANALPAQVTQDWLLVLTSRVAVKSGPNRSSPFQQMQLVGQQMLEHLLETGDPIAFGNNRFIFHSNSVPCTIYFDGGLNWTEVVQPFASTDYSDIAYGLRYVCCNKDRKS